MMKKILPYIFAASSIFLLGNKINENVKENSLDYKVIGQPLSSQDMELLNKDSLFVTSENIDFENSPVFYDFDFDSDGKNEGYVNFYKKKISPNVFARFMTYYPSENVEASLIYVHKLEDSLGVSIENTEFHYCLVNTSVERDNKTIDTKLCKEEYEQWVKWNWWIIIKERD